MTLKSMCTICGKYNIQYFQMSYSYYNAGVPPLLQIHGDDDDLVDLSWGQTTFNELKACGVRGEFYVMDRLGHSINKRGMNIIKEWLERCLPDL